jgi:hypothetical protein
MSYFYKNLRDKISEKFMSVSVNHAPEKDPNFVEDDEIIETSEKVINKESLPIVENLDKPEFLKGDELTREFSFNRDIKVPHILHLCMYNLNRVLQQPFLEFYVIKENNEYVFPHKELSAELFEQFIIKEPEEEKIEPIVEEIVGGDGESEDIDKAFSDQIAAFFLEQTGSPFVIENYKGFLEINNNIFAIIETNKDLFNVKENLCSIIIDEIINKRTINLSQQVLDLFTNNKILTKIGQDIQPPRVLYLCEKEGGIYKNIYYEQQDIPHYTIINEKVLHPTLKTIYLFSEIPLPSEKSIEFIKRYVAFADTLTILDGQRSDASQQLTMKVASLPKEFGEPDGNNYWYARSLRSFVEI